MAYDNVLKRLAAEYPSALVRWLLAVDAANVDLLPTELSLEPVRSDAVYFFPSLVKFSTWSFKPNPDLVHLYHYGCWITLLGYTGNTVVLLSK